MIQQALEPDRFSRAAGINYEAWYNELITLPSICHGGAPVMRMSRWFSVSDVWRFFRREFFLLRLVLQEMADSEAEAAEAGATRLIDGDPDASTKKQGLLSRAYTYVTMETALLCDVYSLVTDPLHRDHARRIGQVLSADDFVTELLREYDGAWQQPVREIIRDALHAGPKLDRLVPPGDCGDNDSLASAVADLTIHLIAGWCMRHLPMVMSYPAAAVILLGDDDTVEQGRDLICNDFHAALLAEDHAHRSEDVRQVVDDVHWLRFPAIRLLFAVCENDRRLGRIEQCRWVARGLAKRLGDEAAPENLHQHTRDCSRNQRHKYVPPSKVYAANQTSGVLEQRQVHAVHIDAATIATSGWYSPEKRKPLKQQRTPSQWPPRLDGMLSPVKDWTSTTTPAIFSAMISWRRIQRWDWDDTSKTVRDSWWSRLFFPGTIAHVRDQGAWELSLVPENFGCLTAPLTRLGDLRPNQ